MTTRWEDASQIEDVRIRHRRIWTGRRALAGLATSTAFGAVLVSAGPIQAVQASVNGIVSGTYIGLGALGLTLAMSVTKVVNLAHGDLLVAGAYLTILFGWLGVSLPVAATLAIAGTALIALASERLIWRPLRRSGASTLQVLLSAIGLALVIRFTTQFFAGSHPQTLGADVTATLSLGPLRIGTHQALVLAGGLLSMLALSIFLRFTHLGLSMRAFADNAALADATGIDGDAIADTTWVVAGALAGLAGILYSAAVGSFNPNFGLMMLLSLFAATLLGGVGSAYGALAGGLVIGLAQEWSVLLISARWKPAIGFMLPVIFLLFMPRGLFRQTERDT